MRYSPSIITTDQDIILPADTRLSHRITRTTIWKIYVAVFLVALTIVGTNVRAVTKDDAQTLLKEARARTSQGLTTEAINLYRRIVRLLPQEPNVRKELARLLASRRETRGEAEKVYAEATVIVPDDANLALERAVNLAIMGDNVNASLEYRRAFELMPDNEKAIAGYIQQITRLGSASVAIKRLSEKLAATPSNIASRLMLAELLRNDGRYNDALDQFSLLQSSDPHNVIALRGIAEAWLSLGFYNRAAEAFRQADLKAGRGRFLANQARVLLVSGQPEAALKLLNISLTDVDKEPLALVVLADSYRSVNQPAQERETLEKLLELFPASPYNAALERLARVRFEMGEKEASIKACQQLLNYDPQNSIGALGLILSGDSSGKNTLKEISLTPARRAAKDQAEAEAAMFWNQSETVIVALRKVLLVRENYQRLLLALGSEWLRKGNAEEALKVFAQVAISNGKRPDALFGMAQAEALRGNPQRALDIYVEILKADPTNFRALTGQAENLHRMGNIERAAILFKDLHKRAPESGLIRERLLKILISLGRSYKPEQELAESLSTKGDVANTIQQPSPAIFIKPVLKAGDVVKITVTGRPGLSAEIRVDSEGTVKLPFLSRPLHAECLTEQELSSLITKYSGAQLDAVTFTTNITEFHRASLLVSGAVYLPGRFNIRKTLGLHEALMLASGANPRAGHIVYVVRGNDSCGVSPHKRVLDGVETYERSEIEKGSLSLTQPLRAGDAVIVPEMDSVFIVGEVARPGSVTASNSLRLLEALEQRGGLLAGARSDHIILSRLMPNGTARKRFLINLDEIKQHRVGDVILQPGDLVEVPSVNKGRPDHSFAKVLQRATPEKLPTPIPSPSQVSISSRP